MGFLATCMNIIWFFIGGLPMAIGYFFVGLINCITIIGIPGGIVSFKLAGYIIWPFGREVVSKDSGGIKMCANVIWIIFGGFWMALGHLISGILMIVFIITIPLAKIHFDMMKIVFAPFGKEVVKKQK